MKGIEIDEESMTKLRDIAVTLGMALSMDSEAALERLIFALQGDSMFKQIWGDQRMDEKTIEKALMRLNEYMDGYAIAELASVIVESKQVIVIECEVKHRLGLPGAGQPWEVMKTMSYGDRRGLQHEIYYRGKRKFIGKALAIIIPLEKRVD